MLQTHLCGVLLVLCHQAKSLCANSLNHQRDISITVGDMVPYEA